MNITEEQLDEVGRAADSLDNLIAAANLPMPASRKLHYTLGSLRALSAKLKAIVVTVGGDDPWGDKNE